MLGQSAMAQSQTPSLVPCTLTAETLRLRLNLPAACPMPLAVATALEAMALEAMAAAPGVAAAWGQPQGTAVDHRCILPRTLGPVE